MRTVVGAGDMRLDRQRGPGTQPDRWATFRLSGWNSSAALVALAAMLWGTDALFRVPLLGHLSPDRLLSSVQLVFMEHLILAVLFVPVLVRASQELRRLTPAEWLSAAWIGIGASALATVLFTISFGFGHYTETLLLQKTQPLFALVLARVFLHERLSRRGSIWFVIAVVAALLIVFSDPFDPFRAWSDMSAQAGVFAIVAAALWAGGTVFGRIALGRVRPTTVAGLRFCIALPALALILVLVGGTGGYFVYRPQDAPLYIGLALLPGGLGMLLYYRGLARTSASVATLAELAFPITGLVVNYWFLSPRQTVSLWQVLGIVALWVALAAIDRTQSMRSGEASLVSARAPTADGFMTPVTVSKR